MTGAIWPSEQEIGPGNERFTMHTHTHTHTQLCFVTLKTEALYEVTVLNIRERVAAKAHTHTYSVKV